MKKFFTCIFIFIALVLILSPSINFGLAELYDEKRILQGIVLLLNAVLFSILFLRFHFNINRFVGFSLSILLFLFAINILFVSDLKDWSVLDIGWYVALFQLSIVTAHYYRSHYENFNKAFLIVVFSVAVLYSIRAAATVIQSHLDPNWVLWPNINRYKIIIDGESFGPEPFMGFAHIRFLNHLHTWTLPIMVGGYLKFKGGLETGFKILIIFIIATWWSLVFASDARGTSLALLLSLLFVIIVYRKNAFQYFKILGFTAFIGLIIYFVGFHLFHETGGKVILTRTGTTGRLELWAAALEYISQNPLGGLGAMHFSNVQNPYLISSPHSMYLLWGAEWGLPALLLVLATGFWLIYKWLKLTMLKSNILNVSLTASLFAVLIHSNFSGLFISPLSQLIGCLIIGIMIGGYYKATNKNIFQLNIAANTKQKVIGSLLIALSIVTVSIFVSHIPELNDRREKFKEEMNSARIYPRFWDQGFIGND